MKKITFLILAALAIVSCQKNPDMGKLSTEYLVYTSFDQAQFPTPSYLAGREVYVPDSIAVLNADGTTARWDDAKAVQIIQAYIDGLEDYGYDVVDATVGELPAYDGLKFSMTYVKNINFYITESSYYWWWSDFYFWPDWYYPYPYAQFTYATSSISMTAELFDAADAGVIGGEELPVRWNAFLNGFDFGSQDNNADYILRRIPQAFAQSPYLQTNIPN